MKTSISHTHQAARRLAAVAAVVLPVGLSACSSGIDTEKAETAIKDNAVNKTGVAVEEVVCPDDVPQEKGHTFECTLKGADDTEAPITVTQKDDEGNVTFEADLVKQDRVESTITEDIQTKLPIVVDSVDCPDVVELEAGKVFTCTVTTDKGETVDAEVTLTDDQGGFEYKTKDGA